MPSITPSALSCVFGRLAIRPRVSSPLAASLAPIALRHNVPRHFSTTRPAFGSWLEPNIDRTKKMKKGRPRVPTGGSTKGTTVIWGDYGLRLRDHHRRISAQQLKLAEETIKNRLRGQKFRLYKRVSCSVGVYTSGNDVSALKWRGRVPALQWQNRILTVVVRLCSCVWVKAKVASITGRPEWPSAKSCLSSKA